MKAKYLIPAITIFFLTKNVTSQTSFYSNMKNDKNMAKFESSAPLETIVGVTNKISSTITINPTDITKNPAAKVTVDLTTLNTGIKKRDEDMKSKEYLNTAKYPNAEFVLTEFTEVDSKELKDKTKITGTAIGKLTIHGVTKEISAPVAIYYFEENSDMKGVLKGNLLSVHSAFNIKLSDYDIKIPAILFYKLEDNIKISVAFTASDIPELAKK